jgi:hypothetical protein
MGGATSVFDPVETIPDPDTIRRKIGETSHRLAILRRLLRVSEKKERVLLSDPNRDRTEALRDA